MCCVLHSYCKTNDIYLKKETEVIYFLSVLQHDSTVRFFFLLVMSWTILPFNSFCFQSPQKQIRNMPVLSRQACPKQRSQKYFKKGWNIEDSLVWKAQEELPSFRNAIAFSVFVCLFCTALSGWSPVLKGDKETASLETVGGGSLPLSGHL